MAIRTFVRRSEVTTTFNTFNYQTASRDAHRHKTHRLHGYSRHWVFEEVNALESTAPAAKMNSFGCIERASTLCGALSTADDVDEHFGQRCSCDDHSHDIQQLPASEISASFFFLFFFLSFPRSFPFLPWLSTSPLSPIPFV